jgi:YebC/PmpR family DNA-binding regulatory protein
MSGHSKWATIKRKKGAADAKKGQVFTRLTREIVLAARDGGGDPDSNVRLALAIDRARAQNMPKDNIERAIRRGTGEDKEGAALEEVFYEGYAPHGIALMISCVTENRNRTVADIRHLLTRFGGSLADAGSVSWQFTRKAYFNLPIQGNDFEKIFELAVEAGADDVNSYEEEIEIIAPVEAFREINKQLKDARIQPAEAGMRMVPNNEIELDEESTIHVLKLIEAIEELDDIQEVFSNLSISQAVMERMGA